MSEGPRDFERTEIATLSKPEPCAKSIVPGAEDLRTARGERTQFSIRACAFEDERRLGLVEFASDTSHLLVAQFVRALHHGERVAGQRRVGKDIDKSSDEFDRFSLPFTL